MIEDCSQAHGAKVGGRPVGTFGDIAAFSSMYRKAHIAGGSGGIVYSRNEELFRQAFAHADRGKPRWKKDFSDFDPGGFLFPALNLHTDEISCGIGLMSLSRLQDTIMRQTEFWRGLLDWMRDKLVGEGMIAAGDLKLMRVIEEPEAIVEAIFDYYESRGFQPTRAERDKMLNL